MDYFIEFSPRAWKDIRGIEKRSAQRIMIKIRGMQAGLGGADVKRLTNLEPEYRLRVGDYRVLLTLIVRRIKHRREAY